MLRANVQMEEDADADACGEIDSWMHMRACECLNRHAVAVMSGAWRSQLGRQTRHRERVAARLH